MDKELGELFPKTIVIQITDEMVQNYAEVSQDWNPIHISVSAAEQAGYPEKVVHGMLTMAISTRLVSPLLGEAWLIESYNMKLLAPVYVSDRLTVTGSLLSGNGIRVSGENQNGQVVMRGKLVLASI